MADKIFRVRKGLFGKCVLQRLHNSPSFIGGKVDSTVRDIYWSDVPYKRAPQILSEHREKLIG